MQMDIQDYDIKAVKLYSDGQNFQDGALLLYNALYPEEEVVVFFTVSVEEYAVQPVDFIQFHAGPISASDFAVPGGFMIKDPTGYVRAIVVAPTEVRSYEMYGTDVES